MMKTFMTAAAILIGTASLASAQHWGGHEGWRGGERHEGFRERGFERRGFEGREFRGEGRGHFWHGRWWGYGVGSCWRWSPVGYVWICG